MNTPDLSDAKIVGNASIVSRRGHFQIGKYLVMTYPDLVRRILSDVVVTRCEYLFDMECFDYYAFSERFDEVGPASLAPDYESLIEGDAHTWRLKQ